MCFKSSSSLIWLLALFCPFRRNPVIAWNPLPLLLWSGRSTHLHPANLVGNVNGFPCHEARAFRVATATSLWPLPLLDRWQESLKDAGRKLFGMWCRQQVGLFLLGARLLTHGWLLRLGTSVFERLFIQINFNLWRNQEVLPFVCRPLIQIKKCPQNFNKWLRTDPWEQQGRLTVATL